MSDACCLVEDGSPRQPAENSITGFLSNLFDTSSHPPRWGCGAWSDLEGWLHIAADIGIWASYFAIPAMLIYFVLKHRDVPFNAVFFLFSAFILLCGTTHLMDVVAFYWPAYRILGLLKLSTAVVSLCTAIVLIKLLPAALRLPGLLTTNDRLRKADSAKSEFLANMSHEIRTPMTAILGYAELLIESNSEVERTEYAQTIRRNGQHLLSVLNDILDLSKIEAGKLDVEKLSVDINGLVKDVVELQSARAESKGLTLRTTISARSPSFVDADPVRLRQVMLNVLGNALKFTEVGGVEIRLDRASAAEGHDELRISVVDTGIGMNDEQLSHIFTAFSQADTSTSRRFGGTGLGLAISKRLMELMGGTITVASEVGLGSTFTIVLPIHIEQEKLDIALDTDSTQTVASQTDYDQSKHQVETIPAIEANATPLTGVSILLAEDGIDNQRLISHVLRKFGAQVEIADNGAIAVERALDQGNHYDAILMDMQMPILDGYGATRELRKEGFTGPIIALTAHAMSGDRFRCLEAGCDDYMTKPIDRRVIVETLQRLLKGDALETAAIADHKV